MQQTQFGFDTFVSPLTWRYGGEVMKRIWSEQNKRLLLRKVWIALAKAQAKAGVVRQDQVRDLEAHAEDIDIPRALEIEADIHHDLMAEIRTFAEQCPVGGSIIHLGATSMDVLDNADALRLRDSMDVVLSGLASLAKSLERRIRQYSAVPCMAFTHIQSAEVTTVGYRLAQTGADLVTAINKVKEARNSIRGKGFKGAVGSMASYQLLLDGTGMTAGMMEDEAMAQLGIKAFTVSSQVYTRSQDISVMQALDFMCSVIAKFALDFRMMQSTAIGEWSEPFSKNQVGSSAMPFKRNPINCEKVCGLCRYVHNLAANAWDDESVNILERTLDDSSNRRLYLPQAFLACDEILSTIGKVVEGMNVHELSIKRNMDAYGVFASTEKLLMALGRKGADRQQMHEVIRVNSLKAWSNLQEGRGNNLVELLSSDPQVLAFVDADEVRNLLDAQDYVGECPQRAVAVADLLSEATA